VITKNGVGEIKQLDERADHNKGFRRQESIKQSSRAEKPKTPPLSERLSQLKKKVTE